VWSGEHGGDPDAIIAAKGLTQISDEDALGRIVDDVLAANAAMVAEFKAGKEKAFNALVGQAMKATRARPTRGRSTRSCAAGSAADACPRTRSTTSLRSSPRS
jgi:Asp-tRNA(Asn)/Glu-tRNA(Gln) amidotransferase B subunit